jgi:hypothetical protein
MRKRLIGIGHAVRVFLLLNEIAAIVSRVENLAASRSVIVFSPRPRAYETIQRIASAPRRS